LKYIKDARDFLLKLFIFIKLIKLLFSFEICEQRKSLELLFYTCSSPRQKYKKYSSFIAVIYLRGISKIRWSDNIHRWTTYSGSPFYIYIIYTIHAVSP